MAGLKISGFILTIILAVSLAPVSFGEDRGVLSKYYLDLYGEWTQKAITLYNDWTKGLQQTLTPWVSENEKLKEEIDRLKRDLQYEIKTSSNLKAQIKQLRSEINLLERESKNDDLKYASLKTLFDQQKRDLDSYSKPQAVITNQEVNWKLFDSKGNEYNWSMPIKTYEDVVGYEPRYEYLVIHNTNTNEKYSVMDFRPFVQESFGHTIDDIYDNARNDSDFIWEVWFIVSQLTIYSTDIEDDPRYAIETLTRGGGDCEDLVILILDMIKSSSYTKNWKFELWYIDSKNPTNPQDANHLIAVINNGQYDHFIEATSPPPSSDWGEHYPEGVRGWNYEV